MLLLTKENLQKLPPLYSQDGKGGAATVFVKYFNPCGSWTWYATEGEPVHDENGKEVDFRFFGLVDGLEKELGYFHLSELKAYRGPFGLGIERDRYFTPKPLNAIAPELFD